MPFTLLFSLSRTASRENSPTKILKSASSGPLTLTKSSRYSLLARSRTTYVKSNEKMDVIST